MMFILNFTKIRDMDGEISRRTGTWMYGHDDDSG
jgi:hypothetical protein